MTYADEYRVAIPAGADDVWSALEAELATFGAAGAYLDVIAAEPRRSSGHGLVRGSTLPGFAVADVVRRRHARLTGRHRFSRYALTFTLVPADAGIELVARTDADFPGPHGWIYRQLVITSGAHRFFVRRLLARVRRRAVG